MVERAKLRKREIGFAVALGVVAAGGAGLTIAALNDGDNDGARRVIITRVERVSMPAGPFEGISSIGPQRVVITVGGDTPSIRTQGPAEAVNRLEAVVEDGTLVIRPKEEFRGGNWSRLDSAIFYVTVPKLEAVSLAGSGEVRVDGVKGARFAGSVAGEGSLQIGALQVDKAELTMSGNGEIEASGLARESQVSMLGSGEIDAGSLRSELASLSIVGSGDVSMTVDREARVSMLGSGDVEIDGPAQCSVTRVGSGDVRCEGPGGTD